MRSWNWLLISAAAAASAAAHSAPPAQVEAAYEVRRNGSPVAEVVHRLRHDGSSYELRETWTGRGMYALAGRIERTSRGAVAADGLRPREYSDERTGRRAERATFDWTGGTVALQARGESRSLPLPSGATDRLAFVYEFAFDPAAASGTTLRVVDGRGIAEQRFVASGRERINTPAGAFDAVKLVRHKRGGERAELWLAADRSLIPLRLLIVDEDGTQLDQVLTRISGS